MDKDLYLGVDCGGTSLRIGIIDAQGKLLSSKKIPSPLKTEPETLARKVKLQLGNLDINKFKGIGVGVPGPLDLKSGLILKSSNLGNVAPIPVLKQFVTVFNSKIYLDRDTNVALLGEVWQGIGRGLRDVIMLTLGTGVGGAIMVEGEIERGVGGKAGEIGHMYLSVGDGRWKMEDLPVCGLGHKGCFEALINSAQSLDEMADYLGYGLANIADVFNPQLIIIGGGKVMIGDFLPKAKKVMRRVGIREVVDETRVEYAKLGEWSGVYGAARLAMLG